jgi:hypothetical protein
MRARGGWKLPDNSKVYVEDTPALILPGALALAGHTNCHQRLFPPRFECLDAVAQSSVTRFIKTLCVTDLPYFSEGGELYPFLRTSVAALVMYHNEVHDECGLLNSVVHAVRQAAIIANINNGKDEDSLEVLSKWSSVVKEDFSMRNMTKQTTPTNLQQTLEVQSTMIGSLVDQVQELSKMLSSTKRAMDRVEDHTVNTLETRKTPQKRSRLITMEAIDLSLSSPESLIQSSHLDNVNQGTPEAKKQLHLEKEVVHPISDSKTPLQSTAGERKPAAVPLRCTTKALQLVQSTANYTIQDMLEYFRSTTFRGPPVGGGSHCRSRLSKLTTPNNISSKYSGEVNRVLKVIGAVTTDWMFSDYLSMDKSTQHGAMQKISDRVLDWVVHIEIEHNLRDGEKKSRIKPSVVALGKRIMSFEKNCKKTFPLPNQKWTEDYTKR